MYFRRNISRIPYKNEERGKKHDTRRINEESAIKSWKYVINKLQIEKEQLYNARELLR